MESQRPNHKKRAVKFQEDTNRRVKRRVVELQDVPTSSDMTDEERSQRWRQRPDHVNTFQDANQIIRSCQGNDDSAHSSSSASYIDFAESFATAYNLCYAERDSDDTGFGDIDIDEGNAERGLPLDQMVLLGGDHTKTRGLEGKIMPGLGSHRYTKRKELIHSVLGVQEQLRGAGDACDHTITEGLSAVSKLLSMPSKRFARALGVVDGTLALFEYASPAEEDGEEVEEKTSMNHTITNTAQPASTTTAQPASTCGGMETNSCPAPTCIPNPIVS